MLHLIKIPKPERTAIRILLDLINELDSEIGHLNRQLIMERMRTAELKARLTAKPLTQSDDLP